MTSTMCMHVSANDWLSALSAPICFTCTVFRDRLRFEILSFLAVFAECTMAANVLLVGKGDLVEIYRDPRSMVISKKCDFLFQNST